MLASIKKKKNLLIFFYIFFSLFFKKFSLHFLSFNLFFFFKLKYFFKSNKFYSYFFFKNNCKIFIESKNMFQHSTEDYSNTLIDQISFNKQFYLQKTIKPNFLFFNKQFYYKLLHFFFLNSFLSYNSFFPRTGFFHMFFYKNSKSSSYLININKIMLRWNNFFNLLLSLYLLNLNPIIYSSPFFKEEALALNWNTNLWDINSWKHTYPFFIFKTNYFSQKTSFFYKKLKDLDYFLFIISDCLYHFKNLYFFKKIFFYTIGLISLNINPWIVCYPVIASSNSYFNQIFFLQALVYSQKKILLIQFFFFKKLWNYSSFFKFK